MDESRGAGWLLLKQRDEYSAYEEAAEYEENRHPVDRQVCGHLLKPRGQHVAAVPYNDIADCHSPKNVESVGSRRIDVQPEEVPQGMPDRMVTRGRWPHG